MQHFEREARKFYPGSGAAGALAGTKIARLNFERDKQLDLCSFRADLFLVPASPGWSRWHC